jgi:hypothetical protein
MVGAGDPSHVSMQSRSVDFRLRDPVGRATSVTEEAEVARDRAITLRARLARLREDNRALRAEAAQVVRHTRQRPLR